MGDFRFWLGIAISLLPMALGVMFMLRRKSISARSSSDPRWHVSERTALIAGIVLIVAGGLSLVSRFFGGQDSPL
jgi:tryptophan-rich sensory protein